MIEMQYVIKIQTYPLYTTSISQYHITKLSDFSLLLSLLLYHTLYHSQTPHHPLDSPSPRLTSPVHRCTTTSFHSPNHLTSASRPPQPQCVDDYFTGQASGLTSLTTEHTLARLDVPRMDAGRLKVELSTAKDVFADRVQSLVKTHRRQFHMWALQMWSVYQRLMYKESHIQSLYSISSYSYV